MSDNAESAYFNLNFGNGIHDAVIRSGILDDDEMDGTDDGPLDKYTYPRMDVAEIMERFIHNGTWQKNCICHRQHLTTSVMFFVKRSVSMNVVLDADLVVMIPSRLKCL